MALVPCRECKKEISTDAPSCPHCGAPFPSRKDWRGWGFEWKSQQTLWGYPLVHVAFGRDAGGRLRVAKGIIAIGQFAVGLIAFGQIGIGLLFGFGQVMFGFTALAQFAIAAYFGIGQIATGYIAIGQVVFAYYGLAQGGFAEYLWSVKRRDPEAVELFKQLAERIGLCLGR